MNDLIKIALGLCCAALGMNHAIGADDSEIDMTCDSKKPVIMLVAGRTLMPSACATTPLRWVAPTSTPMRGATTSIFPDRCEYSRASPTRTMWR